MSFSEAHLHTYVTAMVYALNSKLALQMPFKTLFLTLMALICLSSLGGCHHEAPLWNPPASGSNWASGGRVNRLYRSPLVGSTTLLLNFDGSFQVSTPTATFGGTYDLNGTQLTLRNPDGSVYGSGTCDDNRADYTDPTGFQFNMTTAPPQVR